MQTCECVALFSCAPAPRGRITVSPRVRALRHLLSLMRLRCLIFSITLQTSDIVHSRSLLNTPPREASPGPGSGSSILQSGNFTLALASFHLCPSDDCVPVFGRKMGLCVAQHISRAQRPLVKSSRFGPRWLASPQFLQVLSNSIFPSTPSATTGLIDFQFPVRPQFFFRPVKIFLLHLALNSNLFCFTL